MWSHRVPTALLPFASRLAIHELETRDQLKGAFWRGAKGVSDQVSWYEIHFSGTFGALELPLEVDILHRGCEDTSEGTGDDAAFLRPFRKTAEATISRVY